MTAVAKRLMLQSVGELDGSDDSHRPAKLGYGKVAGKIWGDEEPRLDRRLSLVFWMPTWVVLSLSTTAGGPRVRTLVIECGGTLAVQQTTRWQRVSPGLLAQPDSVSEPRLSSQRC